MHQRSHHARNIKLDSGSLRCIHASVHSTHIRLIAYKFRHSHHCNWFASFQGHIHHRPEMRQEPNYIDRPKGSWISNWMVRVSWIPSSLLMMTNGKSPSTNLVHHSTNCICRHVFCIPNIFSGFIYIISLQPTVSSIHPCIAHLHPPVPGDKVSWCVFEMGDSIGNSLISSFFPGKYFYRLLFGRNCFIVHSGQQPQEDVRSWGGI